MRVLGGSWIVIRGVKDFYWTLDFFSHGQLPLRLSIYLSTLTRIVSLTHPTTPHLITSPCIAYSLLALSLFSTHCLVDHVVPLSTLPFPSLSICPHPTASPFVFILYIS